MHEGLPDILALEVWMSCQHLLKSRCVGDLPHDHRDRDPHAADRSPAAQDLSVGRDSVERHLDTSTDVHSILPTGHPGRRCASSRVPHRADIFEKLLPSS